MHKILFCHLRYKLYITSLLLLSVLVADFEINAYYESDDPDEELFFFQPDQNDLTVRKGERKFVLYDNFKHPLGRYHQKQLIFPASDQFVPVDLIDFDFTVYNVLGHRFVGKYSMTNFIYANLRLEKIKEDYEAVQIQARMLLSDVETSYENINLDSLNSAEKLNTEKKGAKDKKESVHAKISKLKQKQKQQKVKPKPPEKKGPDVKDESIHLKIRRLKRNSRMAGKRARRPQSEDNIEEDEIDPGSKALPDPNLVAAHPSEYQHERNEWRLKNQAKKKKGSYMATNPSSRAFSDHDREEDPLPLIFQMPSDLARYLLANKLEALISGIIMMFLIAIVTSLRPRGKGPT